AVEQVLAHGAGCRPRGGDLERCRGRPTPAPPIPCRAPATGTRRHGACSTAPRSPATQERSVSAVDQPRAPRRRRPRCRQAASGLLLAIALAAAPALANPAQPLDAIADAAIAALGAGDAQSAEAVLAP